MAQGKRILITSRSSDALDVIKEKITGPQGVFDVGDDLQRLIFSWGDQKKALQRFSAAKQVLHDLKDGNNRHAADLETDRVDTKRYLKQINDIEQIFSGTSQIACVRLNQIAAQTSGKHSGLAAVAKAIEQMCNVDALRLDAITETRERTPYKLALRIQAEMDETEAFKSFAVSVEEDLNRTLEDDGKRQQFLTWFESASASNLRADLKNQQSKLVQEDDESESASAGSRQSVRQQIVNKLGDLVGNLTRTNRQNPSQEVEKKSKIDFPPGFERWKQQITEAVNGDVGIDVIVPEKLQTYVILLSCKHFLAKLKKAVLWPSMDEKYIKSRAEYEENRRKTFKTMVGKETRRHAIERFDSPNLCRQLACFVQQYGEFSKMLGRSTKDRSKKYYDTQHELFELLKARGPDGRAAYLLDALPIWIMPTELVSQMLPAELGLFDLVILEEASQSDCQVIPVLLRGKKVVIIGDNDQVNPPASTPEFKHIISEKLKRGGDLPAATINNLLPGRSIFDLFEKRFAERMTTLREHFRCVRASSSSFLTAHLFLLATCFARENRCLPEIIGFSNDLCYGNRLIPMREHETRKSGRPFGPVIQTQFVEGGKAFGTKPVNEMEAQEIVRQVRRLLFSCATSTFDVRILSCSFVHRSGRCWSKMTILRTSRRNARSASYPCGTRIRPSA